MHTLMDTPTNNTINQIVHQRVLDNEQYLSSLDKDRLLIDPLYSKTIFACMENDLYYKVEHQLKIQSIDAFISNKSILDVIVSLGSYEDITYRYINETDEWIYIIPATNKGLIAIVDDCSIQVRKLLTNGAENDY